MEFYNWYLRLSTQVLACFCLPKLVPSGENWIALQVLLSSGENPCRSRDAKIKNTLVK
jgi:hypothetical protein